MVTLRRIIVAVGESTTLNHVLALLLVLCLSMSDCSERDKQVQDYRRFVTQIAMPAMAGDAGDPTERARTYVLINHRDETLYLYFGLNQSGPRFDCRSLTPVRQIAKGQQWQVTIPPDNWGFIQLQSAQDPCDQSHHRWISGALRPARGGQPTSIVLQVD